MALSKSTSTERASSSYRSVSALKSGVDAETVTEEVL
jgi:hypothetical protein